MTRPTLWENSDSLFVLSSLCNKCWNIMSRYLTTLKMLSAPKKKNVVLRNCWSICRWNWKNQEPFGKREGVSSFARRGFIVLEKLKETWFTNATHAMVSRTKVHTSFIWEMYPYLLLQFKNHLAFLMLVESALWSSFPKTADPRLQNMIGMIYPIIAELGVGLIDPEMPSAKLVVSLNHGNRLRLLKLDFLAPILESELNVSFRHSWKLFGSTSKSDFYHSVQIAFFRDFKAVHCYSNFCWISRVDYWWIDRAISILKLEGRIRFAGWNL